MSPIRNPLALAMGMFKSRLNITRFHWTEILLFLLFGYFFIEYKPFEHRLIHVLSKMFKLGPSFKLPFDLSIFLSDLVIFAIGIYCITTRKDSVVKREKKWLLIVVIFALLSLLFTPFSKQLNGFTRFIQLVFSFFFFYVLSCVLSKKSPLPFIQVFLAIIAVAGVIEAVIGLTHYLWQQPIGLHKLGEPKLTANSDFFASIPTMDGKVWLFSLFKGPFSSLLRSHGTFIHPNLLGCFLLTSLLATIYWLFSKKLLVRIMGSTALLIQVLCLITTFSRASLFGFFIGSALLLSSFKLFFKQRIAFVFIVIVSSILIGFVLFSTQIQKRGGIVNQTELSQGSNTARVYYAKIALKMMLTHPFLGIGYDLFPANIKHFVSKEEYDLRFQSTVHNIYLFIGSQTGIPSLLSFLLFLALIVKNGFKHLCFETATLLTIFTCYLWMGLFDNFFLLFQPTKILFFSIAGMIAGYHLYFSNVREAQRDGCCSILDSFEETEKC